MTFGNSCWTPTDFVIGHVTAVLPHRVVDNARVVVREGRIAEVGPHPPGAGCTLDAHGAHLLPGLVDVHTDILARETRPRPGVVLDPAFALMSAGGRLRAAGITTAFHGLAFQERSIVGTTIGSPAAPELSDSLRHADDTQVDHQVLHRLDARCEYGRTLLATELAAFDDSADSETRRSITTPNDPPHARVPIVSHEDHTPGQGQFADPTTMQRWLITNEGMAEAAAVDHVDRWRCTRAERLAVRDRTLTWLGDLARTGHIRLFGHDLATPEDVAAAADRGCTVAEFPTTLDAARAARDRGMLVVAGAPNVVRGGSHTGNVSAAELVVAGVADSLASDYLPSSMLPAAVRLVRDGVLSLPHAVRLITSGPAACVGLNDRGVLTEGFRADLVLTDLSKTWPVAHVISTQSHTAARE